MVASNLHINLFIKLCPLLVGMYYYAGCPKGHTVSKNGSISFFYAGCPEGHTVSKNGSMFFFS